MECLAEMTEAGITDLHRRFGDVEFSRLQKIRGPFHPQLPDVLGNGHAGGRRECPAEMKRAAPDCPADVLEGGRCGQVFFEKSDYFLHSFGGKAVLALTKQFLM